MEKLPTKTKIAAWWMIGIGGVGLIPSIGMIITYLIYFIRETSHPQTGESPGWWLIGALFVAITSFLPSLFFLFPGLFLFKRKKWAWQISIIIIILLIILFCLPRFPFFSKVGISPRSYLPWILLFVLPPLILLLLDHKNFWKVAK